MIDQQSPMAQPQQQPSSNPGRHNVGRLVQQLRTQIEPGRGPFPPPPPPPAAAGGTVSSSPTVNTGSPLSRGRSSPIQVMTVVNPSADGSRHAVCPSPLSSSPVRSKSPFPPYGTRQQPQPPPQPPLQPDAAAVPRRPVAAKPLVKQKPLPMPKPRDKPRVNASNQVVVSVKSRSRSGRRFSPKTSPQNTMEACSTNAKAKELLEAAVQARRPLPVPKPRVDSNYGGKSYSPENGHLGAEDGNPEADGYSRADPVLAAAAAAVILSSAEGSNVKKEIKKRPVRRRSVKKVSSSALPTAREAPPLPVPYHASKISRTRPPFPLPVSCELAGAPLQKTYSESSMSSGGPSDDCSAGSRVGSSSTEAGQGDGEDVCYEAVERDATGRIVSLCGPPALDEHSWEDVEPDMPQAAGPGNMARIKNMAGRILKASDGQVTASAKKASGAIAAMSAFFRPRPRNSPNKDSTSGYQDDDLYSDVSDNEWGDNEEDAVYSCIEERETPYSSAPVPPLNSLSSHVHNEALPPPPEGEYTYATAGAEETPESPRARQAGRSRLPEQLFYQVSENTALEVEVVVAGLPTRGGGSDDDYFQIKDNSSPSKSHVPVKSNAEPYPSRFAALPPRSQSPAKAPRPVPASKTKRAVPSARPPCRPPLPACRTLSHKAELPEPAGGEAAAAKAENDPNNHDLRDYSAVDLSHKSSVTKVKKTYSVDSWGNTPPPPLMERIRTASPGAGIHPLSTSSPDMVNADTLTQNADGWDNESMDTFVPGHPPPRHASISASESSTVGAEFQTVLQRHKAMRVTHEESSEDEDELTNNSALGTICSSGTSAGESRTNTLDRVVFHCAAEDTAPKVRCRSMIVEGDHPAQQADRLSYINVRTLPQTADGSDFNAPFYQNTGEVLAEGEPDQGDLFDYGELPFRGDDGSVAIRPPLEQARKPSMDNTPLRTVRNKQKRLSSSDRLSSTFGLEEPALYQYVSDLNFKGSPLVPMHFGDRGSAQYCIEEDDEEEFQDDDNAIYQGLDSVSYESIGKYAPNKKLRESVRETKKRMLWCEQPKVRCSGILSSIKEDDRRLQEAHFEVITSEISYNRSLKILIDHFMDSTELSPDLPADQRVLSRDSYKLLFSNIRVIYDMSCRLLEALRDRESQSICLETVCDTIYDFVTQPEFFDPYVTYCKNQVYQLREMKRLQETSPRFNEAVTILERKPVCQGLPLLSFFTLPTQRVTRLPLLIVAIIDWIQPEDENYEISRQALELTQALVRKCNEAARSMERTEQLIDLQQKIDFGKIRQLPLVSSSRWLVRSGELTLLTVEKAVIRKGVRVHRQPFHLFLFNDLLIMAKKKAAGLGLGSDTNTSYSVIDYAWRSAVELEDVPDQAPSPAPASAANGSQYAAIQPAVSPQQSRQGSYEIASVTAAVGAQNALKLVLIENAYQKNAVFLMVTSCQSEKYRWMEAVNPAQPTTDGETIYGQWDCPQVKVTYPYSSRQPDELTLSGGEAIKVLRKMPDGWYEGERLRDGLVGWFPSTHCKEIQNEHTRMRNIRHHYHMLNANKKNVLTPIKPEKPATKPTRSPRKLPRLARLNSADKG